MLQRNIFLRLSLATVSAFAVAASAQEPPESAAPPPQSATRLFVSDKLVLNVYTEPAQAGERVATIETGDEVAELERADTFVRVRLDDGREGWVGASYLITEPPAAVQLRELQRERKTPAPDRKTTEELARLRKENASLSAQVKQLEADAAAAAESIASMALADEEASDDTTSTVDDSSMAEATASMTWWAAAIMALIAGGAGFAAGYQTLARRIREKFGGLKIYQ